MSQSGNEFIAKTQGTWYTMYSMMRALGVPLTEQQKKFQAYLEDKYPPIVLCPKCGADRQAYRKNDAQFML